MRVERRTFLAALVLTAIGCSKRSSEREIVVAAATSLRKALPDLVDAFRKSQKGLVVTVTYGASGALARQVEAGAAIDVVLFAAKLPVDELASGGHVARGSARVVATNELVLIGTAEGPKLRFETLASGLPPGERLAIGEPGAVPAGHYAREALQNLGAWKDLEGRVVYGGNVAAVLAYVERGEVPVGIVYRTEIEGAKGIVVLDVAKGSFAPRPEVWGAITARSRAPEEARSLLDFTVSPEGRRILEAHGFGPSS